MKSRYWGAITYPESMPADWIEIVDEFGIGVYAALHDRDLTKDGSPKKEHFHFIFCFDGPTTYNRALSLAAQLGASTVKPLNSLRGSVRYLIHLDSPSKAQYCEDDVLCWGGVDLSPMFERTEMQTDDALSYLLDIILERDIKEFSVLVLTVRSEYPALFGVVRGQRAFLNDFLKSMRGMTTPIHI